MTGKGERREMFTNQTGVFMTTCEEIAKAYGNAVWLELAGCGASDSHTFTHRHNIPEYITKMYKGKIVRLMGERSWDYREQMWGYRWTLHAVNVWDNMVKDADHKVLAMCGTNC
jgi:hypothetical protein